MVSLGAGNLEDKTITIVYGVDFVNTNYLNFCSNKIEVASTWCSELWRYVRQINPLSICATNNLRKIHTEVRPTYGHLDDHLTTIFSSAFFPTGTSRSLQSKS